jgi:hypothetical protein
VTSRTNETVIARSTFEDIHVDRTYRYTTVANVSDGLPERLVLEKVENGTASLLVEGERTAHTSGDNRVDVDGWTAIDVNAKRDGVELLPWDRHPPRGEDTVLYPVDEAYAFASKHPSAVAHRARHDVSFVQRADYFQDLDTEREDPVASDRFGRWHFAEVAPDRSGVSPEVNRAIPEAVQGTPARDEPVDSFVIHAGNPSERFQADLFVPREKLPDEVIPVADAVRAGLSEIDGDREAFDLTWRTPFEPRMVDTSRAITYTMHCPDEATPRLRLDATTDGVIERFTLFSSSCN